MEVEEDGEDGSSRDDGSGAVGDGDADSDSGWAGEGGKEAGTDARSIRNSNTFPSIPHNDQPPPMATRKRARETRQPETA